jgi:hypothetical protein
MRSIFALRNTNIGLTKLQLNANLKAHHGLYLAHAAQSIIDNVLVTNSVKDGAYVAATQDTGAAAINDFITAIEFSAIKCGRVYATAGYGTAYGNLAAVVAPGEVTCKAAVPTIWGSDTRFLEIGARPGDLIRVGTSPDEQVLEIFNVVSDKEITLANDSLPARTFDLGHGYAIGVGDGWHEEQGTDNNRLYARGGLMRYCAGSGWVCRGLYGPTLEKGHHDGLGFYAIVIGNARSVSGPYNSRIAGAYFEGNGGAILGAIYAAGGFGLTIDQPMWTGASIDRILRLGNVAKNTGVYLDERGIQTWGGQLRFRDQEYVEHVKSRAEGTSLTRAGEFTGFAHIMTGPTRAGQIPIMEADHSGKVDINAHASYRVGGNVVGGAIVSSVGYTYQGGALTLGMTDILTPTNQVNPDLTPQTLQLERVGNVPYISIYVHPNTNPGSSGRNTTWEFEVKIMMAR